MPSLRTCGHGFTTAAFGIAGIWYCCRRIVSCSWICLLLALVVLVPGTCCDCSIPIWHIEAVVQPEPLTPGINDGVQPLTDLTGNSPPAQKHTPRIIGAHQCVSMLVNACRCRSSGTVCLRSACCFGAVTAEASQFNIICGYGYVIILHAYMHAYAHTQWC